MSAGGGPHCALPSVSRQGDPPLDGMAGHEEPHWPPAPPGPGPRPRQRRKPGRRGGEEGEAGTRLQLGGPWGPPLSAPGTHCWGSARLSYDPGGDHTLSFSLKG